MSLFSNALVANRGSGSLASYGDFDKEIGRDLGLTRFDLHAQASLGVAADPAKKLDDFMKELKAKQPGWKKRYDDVKTELYDNLGFSSEEAHTKALAAAKALAESDISITSAKYPYILDENSLVGFTVGRLPQKVAAPVIQGAQQGQQVP